MINKKLTVTLSKLLSFYIFKNNKFNTLLQLHITLNFNLIPIEMLNLNNKTMLNRISYNIISLIYIIILHIVTSL